MKASISKIETFSTVDGPGIRTTIFFNGCKLRCKYCHNPETWLKQNENYTVDELVEKIKRSKPYFKNNGGVTLSGGEPLLHDKFLIDLCQKLRKENIHIALDTAGIGNNNYKEILELVDLIIFDIKWFNQEGYKDITQTNYFKESEKFIEELNNCNKDIWIRQVIIPNKNDNIKYIKSLAKYIKQIKNIKKVELLPFHTMAFEKYKKLNIKNPYQNIKAMDKVKCQELENILIEELMKETTTN